MAGGIGGQAADISIHANEILRERERLYNTFSATYRAKLRKNRNRCRPRFLYDCLKKHLEYGIVDTVVTHRQ